LRACCAGAEPGNRYWIEVLGVSSVAYSAGRVAFLLIRLAYDRRLIEFVFVLFDVVGVIIIVVVGVSRRCRLTWEGERPASATRLFLLQASVKLEGIEGHVAPVLPSVCEGRAGSSASASPQYISANLRSRRLSRSDFATAVRRANSFAFVR